MNYKISKGMWWVQMGSRWLEPEPIPRQDDYTPTHNPNAPSFADMKRQVGKKPPTMRKKMFLTKGSAKTTK
jgi:hypothetical protein